MTTLSPTFLPQSTTSRTCTVLAWAILALASQLPALVLREIAHVSDFGWLAWAQIGLLAGLTAATFSMPAIRPLRHFFIALLAVYLLEMGAIRLQSTPFWIARFGNGSMPFVNHMLGVQLARLLVALGMIAMLLGLGYRRKQFFLTTGDLRAPAEPVRLLGIGPQPWSRLGRNFAIIITLGTLAFLVLAGRPSAETLLRALPFFPAVLLFAAMNAFSEEMTYRAALLGVLEGPVGSRSALWITALFFGIGHFDGVPYGVIGVTMATFLGWLLGKSMLETRGFGWAWFIHVLQDIAIFSFMAIGSIAACGG